LSAHPRSGTSAALDATITATADPEFVDMVIRLGAPLTQEDRAAAKRLLDALLAALSDEARVYVWYACALAGRPAPQSRSPALSHGRCWISRSGSRSRTGNHLVRSEIPRRTTPLTKGCACRNGIGRVERPRWCAFSQAHRRLTEGACGSHRRGGRRDSDNQVAVIVDHLPSWRRAAVRSCPRRAAELYVDLAKRDLACDLFLIGLGEEPLSEDLFTPNDARDG
jgi:hypothetical protein